MEFANIQIRVEQHVRVNKRKITQDASNN